MCISFLWGVIGPEFLVLIRSRFNAYHFLFDFFAVRSFASCGGKSKDKKGKGGL